MIKFFRNIRQNLLKQGKTANYLKYAIGEIVLVVIGILIAIQINNWNEDYKQQKTQQIYLQKLSIDVDSMVKQYEDFSKRFPEFLLSSENALRYIETCGESDEDKLPFEFTMNSHQSMFNYPQNRNTFDEMLSNGSFSNLEDESLKASISSLYATIERSNSQINYFRDEIGRASAIINTYVLFSYDSLGSGVGNQKVSYNLGNLCDNILFKNALVEIVDSRRDWLFGSKEILTKLKTVNKNLNNY